MIKGELHSFSIGLPSRPAILEFAAMTHSSRYLELAAQIASGVDAAMLEQLADALVTLRESGGRLFFLGVGGSAGNCGHAVNDFRKLAGIEAYAPTDNVSELTARTNDEGWDTVFSEWIIVSKGTSKDALFIMSVGGGDAERNVSHNLVKAIDEAKKRGMKVFGIVGRANGYTHKMGDIVLVVPTADPALVTPLSESFQAVLWHGLVSNPKLCQRSTKWEGLDKK